MIFWVEGKSSCPGATGLASFQFDSLKCTGNNIGVRGEWYQIFHFLFIAHPRLYWVKRNLSAERS